MFRQSFVNFVLGGVNLNSYGVQIPSPFTSLELSNSEISSFTTWKLQLTVGGDASKKVNVASFEALLYSAAQAASKYSTSSGIPVSFMFGWLDASGAVSEYTSYQGTTIKYSASCSGMFTTYTVEGYASLSIKSAMPVLNVPALSGYVQPSAVLLALIKAVKADTYYEVDVDTCDNPVYLQHNAITTSFNQYVRGDRNGQDDFDTFSGLLPASKTYNCSRDAAGLVKGAGSLSTVLKNAQHVDAYLKKSLTDNTPQCSSYAFWIDEPTMTRKGTIHYKAKSSLMAHDYNTLRYGTSDSNILTISGNYNGIAYNISDMNFAAIGFSVDERGQTIVNDTTIVNSWSNSLAEVFQTANIINDINALATQFSGDFTVTIPGTVKQFGVCEPVSLVVMSGNTLSPVSGIYNIMSVSHTISTTFVTTLKLQRLAISSANQVAVSMGIYAPGSRTVHGAETYTTTSNVKSPSKVDFGVLYPTMENIATLTC